MVITIVSVALDGIQLKSHLSKGGEQRFSTQSGKKMQRHRGCPN